MLPLGHTRPLLAYGLPAAAGLAVGGALAGQGLSPGTAVLGGAAAALGARGGLGAARLAGQYAPFIREMAQEAILPVGRAVRGAMKEVPAGGKRAAVLGKTREGLLNLYAATKGITPGMVNRAAAAGAVPLAAGLAGLGGYAASAIPAALNMPGFTPGVDPESYGSSNSLGARYKTPTMQYV